MMDATKLVEEAEIWAREIHASAFSDGAYWSEKFLELATALKVSEERARKAEDELGEIWLLTTGKMSDTAPRAVKRTLDQLKNYVAGQQKRADRMERERDAAQTERTIAQSQARDLAAELARLTTPRPIAEAPLDGTWVQIHWNKEQYPRLRNVRWAIARYVPDCFVWVDERQEPLLEPTEYLPLPEVQP